LRHVRHSGPIYFPGTQESLQETLGRLCPLKDTPAQAYLERRSIALQVADTAGTRFAHDFAGRPAVVQPLYDHQDRLVSLHARYLETGRRQNKMFTIGPGGGCVNVLGGWRAEPLIIVEGLFDALSMAVCGWASVATIGRWAPWLREAGQGRVAWLAMDAGRPGEQEVARYAAHLCHSQVRRMKPPDRDKDWNTALVKRGRATLSRWIAQQLTS
jgi:hypothetical protein